MGRTTYPRYSYSYVVRPCTPEEIKARRAESAGNFFGGLLACGGLIAALPITGGASFFALLPAAIATAEQGMEAVFPDTEWRKSVRLR